MANTPTVDLEKPTVGGSAGTWGDSLNDNADKIDEFFRIHAVRALDSGEVSSPASSLAIELPSDFDAWELELVGFVPSATNPNLTAQLSVNGGSSYLTGSTDYANALFTASSAGTSAASGAADATSAFIAANVGNSSGANVTATVRIGGRSGATPSIRAESFVQGSSSTVVSTAANSAKTTTTKPTHVRVQFTSGNITAGKWALYGKPGIV